MFHVKQPSIVLTLPGWLNSGAGHWQTLWEDEYGDQRVVQADWEQPLRGDWQIGLQEHVLALLDASVVGETPSLILVGHSLGCHLVSVWVKYSPLARHVRAALLGAPPDLRQRSQIPPALRSWSPPVLEPMPFPSYLVCGDNDPYAALEASRTMARAWGCQRCIEIEGGGHLNADSGLGNWAQGRQWLTHLLGSPQST